MLSPVRRLSSVVCNVRAPYSGGSNFPQYFYGVRYLSHPLTSTENFTEIVPGERRRYALSQCFWFVIFLYRCKRRFSNIVGAREWQSDVRLDRPSLVTEMAVVAATTSERDMWVELPCPPRLHDG